jgi:hypothetical protein
LGVTGATTLTGALTANGGATLYGTAGGSGSSVAVSGNTTTITAGATANTAVVDAASARLVSQDANHSIATSNSVNAVTGSTTVAGTLGVTGVTTITSTGTANQMIVDATSSRFLSQNGSHSVVVNNTTTTVNGSEIVYGGSSIYSAATATGNRAIVDSTNARMMSSDTGAGNNQVIAQNSTGAGYTAANNSVVVDNTQTATVGINSLNYGTRVNGGMYIDGSLGVNGNIYSLNPTANATVNIANNGLAITGVTNEVTLVSDNDALTANARAELDLQPTSASLLVNTDVGDAHGISIAQTNTVLSGGTQSTSMTLNDWGATFKNDQTGGPARVTGVADGQNDYDAVNYRQLQKAYAGVASVAALAAIPPPIDGKNFSVGGGYGHYQGQDAVAMGAKARIPKTSVMLTVGTGYCDNNWATSVGAGISF